MLLACAVVALRLIQTSAASVLFGSALFIIYALPRDGIGSGATAAWSRPLLKWSAGALLIASLAGLIAQTSVLAGSVAEGIKPSSLWAVITTMSIGPSALARAGAAALALCALALLPSARPLFWACTILGMIGSASLAWMGHGSATEGTAGLIHLIADIFHVLAAGVWLGALVVFGRLLLLAATDIEGDRVLHAALHGFAGVGSALVAVLIVTGFVNSWFLVGPSRLSGLWTTAYGQLLSLKLLLVLAMLGLAGANRLRLAPALGAAIRTGHPRLNAVRALRSSVLAETTLAFAVFMIVAWLGTLAPVSAQ